MEIGSELAQSMVCHFQRGNLSHHLELEQRQMVCVENEKVANTGRHSVVGMNKKTYQ